MTDINISKIIVDENNLIIKDAQARNNIETLSTNINNNFTSLSNDINNDLKNQVFNIVGKKVSIIGDSISSFTGIIPSNHRSWYPSNGAGVTTPAQTWWGLLINYYNPNDVLNDNRINNYFLKNASYSGSCVTNVRATSNPGEGKRSYPTFAERCTKDLLSDGSIDPDVIIIALGTNDSTDRVTIDYSDSYYDSNINQLSETSFASAYIKGIEKLKQLYPGIEIICIAFSMLSPYSNTIRLIAEHYGYPFINCNNYDKFETNYDNPRHPTSLGMREIVRHIIYFNSNLYTNEKTFQDSRLFFIDKSRNDIRPSSRYITQGINWLDSAGFEQAFIIPEIGQNNNGLMMGTSYGGVSYSTLTGCSTFNKEVYNYLSLRGNPSTGEKSVYVSDKTAWRKGIGADTNGFWPISVGGTGQSISFTTVIKNSSTEIHENFDDGLLTNGTIYLAKWGKHIILTAWQVRLKKDLAPNHSRILINSSSTNIISNYFPAIPAVGYGGSLVGMGQVALSRTGVLTFYNPANSSVTFTSTDNINFTLSYLIE